jgi:outer membrane cobalamin receptor
MTNRRTHWMIGLVVTLSACGIKPRPADLNRNIGTIVTREEIVESGARTMWEAITRTVRFAQFQESGRGKPSGVRRRGASSILLSEDMPIYIDQVRVGDIQILASLSARDIDRIQILNGVDATTYYGTNSGDGVILIFTLEADGGP